jgi:hypothetical protein
LGAEGLHGAVVGEVVGEAVDLQAVLLVHVGLPALKPFVVHQVSHVLPSLFVEELV